MHNQKLGRPPRELFKKTYPAFLSLATPTRTPTARNFRDCPRFLACPPRSPYLLIAYLCTPQRRVYRQTACQVAANNGRKCRGTDVSRLRIELFYGRGEAVVEDGQIPRKEKLGNLAWGRQQEIERISYFTNNACILTISNN